MAQNDNNTVTKISDYRQKSEPTPSTSALKSSGGDGTSGSMEARVTSLEKRFDKFDGKLDALIKDVAEMKGRVSAMPTTWQLIALVLAIMGATFAILKVTAH